MPINQLIKLTVRRPWWLIAVLLIAVVILASGLPKMQFSNDYEDYFSEQNPQLTAWKELQDNFNKSDNVLIAVSVRQGSIFSKTALQAIKELTESGWQFPHAIRVDSLTNFQRIEPIGNDDILIDDLVSAEFDYSQSALKETKDFAINHPQIVNKLLNPTADAAAVNIEVNLKDSPRDEIAEISNHAYQVKEAYKARYPDLDFHITGSVLYNHAMTSATKDDMASLMPLMYCVILILFAVFIRSILATAAVFVLILFSILATMGASSWAGIVLMAPSLSAPTIVTTVAVANAVHVLVSFFRQYQSGIGRKSAVEQMLRTNWLPIVITNATTMIGFLTMNFSDVPPYRDLGNMVAVGLFFVMIFTLFLLPALLTVLPVKPTEGTSRSAGRYVSLANWVIRFKLGIIVSFILVASLSAYGLTKLELNDRFIEWMDERYEFRRDSDFINERLTGLYRLDWGIDSGSEGNITNTDYLQRLDGLANWARRQPGVVHVQSLADTIKELNQNFHGGDPAQYRIPESNELAAQLLLVYEMSLPMGLDLNNMINLQKSSSRFVVRTSNLSTTEILALERRTYEWLERHGTPSMIGEAASTTVLFANISKRNIAALLTSTVVALFLISFLLIVPLRSVKMGILSLVPNLLPAGIAFGIWGLLISEVGLAISVVIGMTMGIVVDDTVHFMTKYLHFRRNQKAAPEEAIRATFEHVGPALLGTSFILTAGFLVLAQSGFEVNQQMGALTGVVIIIAFIADMLLLPSLILVFDRRKRLYDIRPTVSEAISG